jgi:hypothetical protein
MYLLLGIAYQEGESKKIILLVHIHAKMLRLPKGCLHGTRPYIH